MDIDGGYLEIESKEGDLPERIQAKFNRLIIFEAGKYPHEVTEVNRGLRSAIAINLWNPAPSGYLYLES
jgi:Rps23 Pro-64 3,4-dihydroxylase Tpa1-like proline 4-hydroxylase